MPEYSDEKIIELCRDSRTREHGFRILVKHYKERIYWHNRRMLYDHDEANDVTQEVFVKIWKNLDKFRGESKLFSWIYKIATNECLNQLRKIKKQENISFDSVENILHERIYNESMSGDEIERKLHLAILTLPEKQRIVFNMKYFEELKYNEISDILGGSIGSLKASYHFAVKKIEKCLKED